MHVAIVMADGIIKLLKDVIVKGWAEYGPWIPRH